MRRHRENAAARLLGWFSVGLGLHQILFPRTWTRGLGTRNRTGLVRTVFGARELAAGAALLAGRNPAPWLAARAVGDAFDVATLGRILTSRNGRKGMAALALAAVVGLAFLDVAAASTARTR